MSYVLEIQLDNSIITKENMSVEVCIMNWEEQEGEKKSIIGKKIYILRFFAQKHKKILDKCVYNLLNISLLNDLQYNISEIVLIFVLFFLFLPNDFQQTIAEIS